MTLSDYYDKRKNDMLNLISLYWAICRLRATPQMMPAVNSLLVNTVVIGIVVDTLAASLFQTGKTLFELGILVSLYTILMLLAVYFLLTLVGYRQRALQTLIALAGSDLMISLVLLPGLFIVSLSEKGIQSFAMFILIDYVWRIAVMAHIFRYSFSVGLMMGMILSVSYAIFGMFVSDFLVTPQAG